MDKNSSIPPFVEQKPKYKTNKRALFLLFLFFVIILVIVFFQSSLSEIERITVSGNSLVKTSDIIKASGFSEG
ncbi:MAG: cell division protein FtsQ, partial [Bacilli bacterium]